MMGRMLKAGPAIAIAGSLALSGCGGGAIPDKFPTDGEGQGTLAMPNGDKYAGEFHAGKLNGPGTAIFASGTKYAGTFKDGKIEGAGTASYLNGDQYQGTFKDGKLDQGTLTSPSGNTY